MNTITQNNDAEEGEFRAAARLLKDIFEVLRTLEPVADKYDVIWQGPYYIERAGVWRESSFMLYQGVLYTTVEREGRAGTLAWKVGSDEAYLEQGLGFSVAQYIDWSKVLEQLKKKLISASKHPDSYSRRIARQLPLTCRYGKIKRKYTLPENAKPLIEPDVLATIEQYVAKPMAGYETMTKAQYLHCVALAYDAVFDELKDLSPLEKYKRRADGRHCGLLDLGPNDTDAFMQWHQSAEWHVGHPWEIVFGHPHGIMISPHLDEKTGRWIFYLWAGAEGYYVMLLRMAEALAKEGIAFQIVSAESIFSALRGEDFVKIFPSPGIGSVQYEDIREVRPDCLDKIVWDELPKMALISEQGRERIYSALKAQK